MRKLADWFKECRWDVYFNQKNEDGYPKFHGNTNSKPDLLLRKNGYNILIEVKSGEDHIKILDGMDQVLKYCGEYYSGRTKYENGLNIDGFFLATEYSENGFLYKNEDNVGHLNYTGYLARKKQMDEKPISHSLTRFLWRQWESGYAYKYFKEFQKGKAGKETEIPEKKPKIGTIMAKTDRETKQKSNQPYIFANSNHFIPMGWEGEIECFEG